MDIYINSVLATQEDIDELARDGKVIVSVIYYRVNGRETLVIKTNN